MSGIKWIGEVSDDFQMVPLKYLLESGKNSVKVGPFGSQLSGTDLLNEESDFWVYNQRSVIDENSTEGMAFISEDKYKCMMGFQVHAGDILITTRGTIGRIFKIPCNFNKGIIHPCIIKFRIDESRFNYQLLRIIFNESDFIVRQLSYKSNATTIDVIYSETLRNIYMPTCSMEKQKKLAFFLNNKCSEIDALMADIQKEIDILEKYKKSVIIEAVTKGLESDAEMEDSGIEWVGDIPSHWEIHPVYNFFWERKTKNLALKEQNLLSLSYGRIIRKDINTNGGLLPASFNTYNIVEAGDIIIRPTDLQNDKKSLRTGLVTEHGIITSAYIDLKPKNSVNSKYFHYLLHAYDVMKVFYNMGNGVRQGLNYSEFSKLMVFAPPISEQTIIADFLDNKCIEIDIVIEEKKAQTEILKQYKKSLIYEYITGKKEVPENDG